MPNRLASETSPYLLQHRDNPVDWWPWCDEAFEEARRLDRPVLLSVGYSACHWCHVMAHESFENPQIAAIQNELFVNIKVDREERPDVDGIYMQAVVALTGQGGWPMTVFLTPRGVPFYGGTYFPPEDRHQMRGFPSILRAVAQAYRDQREAVAQTGEQLRQALAPPRLGEGELSATALTEGCAKLVKDTDQRYGGFGGAPKFPHPAALDLLLRRHLATGDAGLLRAATITLDRMARGGVYDQVGGGFHRYAVDAQWAVPHFEKMLYDNAQLAPVYLHAWQITGEERWLRVVTEVLDYALREMRLPGGGFASSQDADSEGGEGSFFVWTPQQLREVLGDEDGTLAARIFGVVPGGNFEHGTTVLSLPFPLEQVAITLDLDVAAMHTVVDEMRGRLYAAREQRPHPGRDDKVVTAWNALMLRALAEVGGATGRADYLDAARELANFLLTELVRDGVVLRTWKEGEAKITGFLEDVATLVDGLLTLYEATGEPRWYASAAELAATMVDRYYEQTAGFYDTAVDGEPLLVRPRTLDDNAVPAGRSTAALALLRLALLSGEQRWHDVAVRTVAPLASAVGRAPSGLGNLAWALDLALADTREVAIAGDPASAGTRAMVQAVLGYWNPYRVVAWGDPDGVPLLADRPAIEGRATAYVCRGFTCDAPTTDLEQMRAALRVRPPG